MLTTDLNSVPGAWHVARSHFLMCGWVGKAIEFKAVPGMYFLSIDRNPISFSTQSGWIKKSLKIYNMFPWRFSWVQSRWWIFMIWPDGTQVDTLPFLFWQVQNKPFICLTHSDGRGEVFWYRVNIQSVARADPARDLDSYIFKQPLHKFCRNTM